MLPSVTAAAAITFATGGAAELVPTDTVVCEVYRFRGSSTDEYGIRVNGQSVFTYNTAQSMSNNSTTHKVGFYAFHENPVSGAATITISDFKTCANELKVNPTIELNSNCPKTGEVGTKIKVPSATIKGAFDRTASINPVVKLGTKKITLSSRSYTPTQAGEYTVTWEGADPWGVSATPLTETIVVSDTAADEGEENTEGESEGGDVIAPTVCQHEKTYSEDIEATCTNTGSRKEICAECGEVVSNIIITMRGHSYIDGICERCGKNKGADDSKPFDVIVS
jgi:hypothetical protein